MVQSEISEVLQCGAASKANESKQSERKRRDQIFEVNFSLCGFEGASEAANARAKLKAKATAKAKSESKSQS